jgi:hypothetical protein
MPPTYYKYFHVTVLRKDSYMMQIVQLTAGVCGIRKRSKMYKINTIDKTIQTRNKEFRNRLKLHTYFWEALSSASRLGPSSVRHD